VEIPAELKGYLKTQSEQKRLGLAERYEKIFRSLYFDTAGTGAWRPGLEAALQIAGPDRIMFGTDYPLECKTAANIVESLAVVRAAAHTADDRAAILGTTAAGLFDLSM
jgi:predicted TIM-barrel fold metal-dependent hydrolase